MSLVNSKGMLSIKPDDYVARVAAGGASVMAAAWGRPMRRVYLVALYRQLSISDNFNLPETLTPATLCDASDHQRYRDHRTRTT